MSRDYTSKYTMLEQYCKTEGLSPDYLISSIYDEGEHHYFRKLLKVFKKHA